MDISQGDELRALRVRPARPRRGAHARAVRRGRDARACFALDASRARAHRRASASSAARSTHADRLATIRDVHERFGELIDPHTADGLKVGARARRAGVPMIVLETALPAKFAETIVEALGREPPRPARFEGIEALPRRFATMPADVARLKAFIAENDRR